MISKVKGKQKKIKHWPPLQYSLCKSGRSTCLLCLPRNHRLTPDCFSSPFRVLISFPTFITSLTAVSVLSVTTDTVQLVRPLSHTGVSDTRHLLDFHRPCHRHFLFSFTLPKSKVLTTFWRRRKCVCVCFTCSSQRLNAQSCPARSTPHQPPDLTR